MSRRAVDRARGAYVVTLVSGGMSCQCRVAALSAKEQTHRRGAQSLLRRHLQFHSHARRCLPAKMSKCLPSAEASVRRTPILRFCINARANFSCLLETTTVPSDIQTSTNLQPWPRKYCPQRCWRGLFDLVHAMQRGCARERARCDIGAFCACDPWKDIFDKATRGRRQKTRCDD